MKGRHTAAVILGLLVAAISWLPFLVWMDDGVPPIYKMQYAWQLLYSPVLGTAFAAFLIMQSVLKKD